SHCAADHRHLPFSYTTLFRSAPCGWISQTPCCYACVSIPAPSAAAALTAAGCTSAMATPARAPGPKVIFGVTTPAATSAMRKSRSEEHTSELQSRENLVCRLL